MHSVAWPAYVLWTFIALAVVSTVLILRAHRRPLWVVIVGGVGVAVGSYIVGMVVLIAVSSVLFSAGYM